MFLRVGETTDVVTKEMYDFVDKDGRRIALRPEITAGVVRAFVQHRPLLPWKVWYAGTNFRHERPQKGRYRMFDQVGVEVLGVDDPDLDVEVIALAWPVLRGRSACARSRCCSTPSASTTTAAATPRRCATYLEARARRAVSEAARATLERNPLRVLDSKRPERPGRRRRTRPRIADYLSDGVGGALRAGARRPRRARRRPTPSRRGWCGASTTTAAPPSSSRPTALDAAQNAIGGGGRYDGLAEDLGGPPTDGIGFALGVDRILLACDAEGVFAAPEPRRRRVRRRPRRRRAWPAT